MKTIRTVKQMQQAARLLAAQGKTIGVVPTMGFLHDGHLSLIRKAKQHADVVVTTIFVNPTQFGPREDLSTYPRDERGDLKKIRSAGGDIVFIPTTREVYPKDFQTFVTVEKLTRILEGASRPTHFRGVTTVVAKLFNIIRPDVAVFGMKDFQQATVLRQMTADLGYPIRFIVAPTVRERDGLAMSSRNKYFTPETRPEAVCLYRGLVTARALARAGERSSAKIKREMEKAILATCPSAQIDYIAFNDLKTLAPRTTVESGTVCSLAARVHGVRLIDNLKLR
ncbi:MAG: pantoate--beta-alanine ligase [candidate division Zixibacteria bacterium]|jgi:pantoate--beta-alanine ligase|nr:pantoate--beta-alanine ligase [candidate division Zixibacteria bacterium]